MTWASPDGGEWWFESAHFPDPSSRLFAGIIDAIFAAQVAAARRWGLERRGGRWQQINGFLYFAPRGEASPADQQRFEQACRERWWVEEARVWFEEERPRAVATNQALQAVNVTELDDGALADHVREAVAHVLDVGRLHFQHRGREVVLRRLREQAGAEGIDVAVLDAALAGGSPASRRPAEMVASIAALLRQSGVDPAGITSLDDLRTVAPPAAAALDEYLTEFGHRLVDSYDLAGATLCERPEIIVASIRAAATPRPAATAAPLPDMSADLRTLLDEARVSYGIEEDDDGVCVFWPLGLLRRGLLELGRRRGLGDPSDAFEVGLAEMDDFLEGRGPSATILAERGEARRAAAQLLPPPVIGATEPAPADAPPAAPSGELRGTGVGTQVVRGRACVVRGADDAVTRLEPGDILVAVTTNPGYNAILPIVAGVATEALMGHTIICARELGIPAVVGVAGLLEAITDGAIVEVDATAGIVRAVAE